MGHAYTPVSTEESAPRRHKRVKSCGARATRFLSKLSLGLAAFVVVTFLFFHAAPTRPLHLSPFEVAPLRACPGFFEAIEITAPASSQEFVSIHKVQKKQPIETTTRNYHLGYNVTLRSDGLSPRSHYKTYHFDPVAPFTVHFESTSPVVFFVVHEEVFRHYDHRRHGDHHRDHKNERPHHPRRGAIPAHPAPNHEEMAREHQPAHRGRHEHPHLNEGKYVLVFVLPKNTTLDAEVRVTIEAKVTTPNFKDCPFASTLRDGHHVARLNKREHARYVVAASPHAPTGTVVFVKLVPRAHKFGLIALCFLGGWVVFGLISRALKCRAKYLAKNPGCRGNRSCLFSRIFRRNQPVQSVEVPIYPVANPASEPVFYAPQI